jgi:hypothetical protein
MLVSLVFRLIVPVRMGLRYNDPSPSRNQPAHHLDPIPASVNQGI